MMTPDSAKLLGLKVGDTFPLQLTFTIGLPNPAQAASTSTQKTQAITARVAGLFNVDATNAAYWHRENFKPFKSGEDTSIVYAYTMLVPNESLLAIADGSSARYPENTQTFAQTAGQTHPIFTSGETLRWYYQLDVPHITI